jgi:hypothetical protein
MSLAYPLPRGTRVSPIYACNGVNAAFPVPFWFLDPLDIVVDVTSPAGSVTRFSNQTGFTVSGANVAGGGSVLMAAPPAAGSTLQTIGCRIPSRVTSVYQGARVNGEALDADLDVVTANLQELRRDVDALIANTAFPPASALITRRQAIKSLKANMTAGVTWLAHVQNAISPDESADDNLDYMADRWPAGGPMWLRVQTILNAALIGSGGFTATQRVILEAQAAAVV